MPQPPDPAATPASSLEPLQLKPIAHIRTPYHTKFGVPRQPGLVDALESTVVFEPEFRLADAVRGLEGFEYIWLIWEFSHNQREGWKATVRPPVLGGNKRMGVFATRSSFRPNGLALSSVKLLRVELTENRGPVLHVGGADMVDGTPIYDIKPYIPAYDCHPEAQAGWRSEAEWHELQVSWAPGVIERVPLHLREGLRQVLAQDPRPAYTRSGQEDRPFWLPLAGLAVRFKVRGRELEVFAVEKLTPQELRQLEDQGSL